MRRLSTEYRPRQAEETVLYQILSEHLDAFLEHADTHDRTPPKFVRDELRGFLTCGVLEHGFARCLCDHCGFQRLVPFSCGGRGFCPSCSGRRMADTALRLVDHIIPHVAVRQWVLSLPHALRYLLAYHTQLCTEVLGIFTREVFAWLERAARDSGQVPQGAQVFPGAVTAIQRADSAGKLNLHYHTLALDGAYVLEADTDKPRFVTTPAPTRGDVSAVAWAVCQGTMQLLKKHGLALDANIDELDPNHKQAELLFDPMLRQCAQASMQGVVLLGTRAGQRVLRLGNGPNDTDKHGRAAHGFDLHAGRHVSAHDRAGLERLCRYILRPPLSHERITRTETGQVQLELKRPWSDGTAHLVLDPKDFIARLIPLIPPPRTHRVRYSGVLSSHHHLRKSVLPPAPPENEPKQLHLWPNREGKLAPAPKHRIEWAKLMARTMGFDPLECPNCRRQMRMWGFVTSAEPERIAWYLRHHHRENPPRPKDNRPRGPPQLKLPFPKAR